MACVSRDRSSSSRGGVPAVVGSIIVVGALCVSLESYANEQAFENLCFTSTNWAITQKKQPKGEGIVHHNCDRTPRPCNASVHCLCDLTLYFRARGGVTKDKGKKSQTQGLKDRTRSKMKGYVLLKTSFWL